MTRTIYLINLSVFVLLAGLSNASAQGLIHGQVTNTALEPLSTSLITVQDAADSSLIQTVLPDKNGKYSITLPGRKALLIRASADSYITQQRLLNDTSGKEQTLDFILLSRNRELGAVTVSAAKPLFERKVDRTVFNVSASISAIGGTALDAIKKAPGVMVSSQENAISLVGKSQVQVMVNDRLIQLSGEDLIAYLQSIPSDNIDRIEVITTPPAQYDAAGSTGLINIILKKNKKDGFNGDARAGYEQSGYGTGLGGVNLNHKQGKLNVFVNGSYSKGSKNIIERLRTDFPDQVFQLSDPYKRSIRDAQYTVGADYGISKKSNLSLLLTGTDFKRNDEDITEIRIFKKPALTLDSVIRTTGLSNRNSRNNIFNASYVFNIDTDGKKLSLNGARLWFDGNRDRDYDTQNYYDLNLSPTGVNSRNQNLGVQTIRITTAQADLELPYKWASLSAGGRLSFTNNNSRNKFLYFDQGVFKEDNTISNSFDYEERVEALYISAAKTTGPFEMRAGLRGEWTRTSGYSAKLAQTTVNSYFNIFPTAYLQYTYNDKNVFNVNYSRRINRPGYRALDPYRSYSSPYSYNEGNPFLQASFTDNIELSYTWQGKYSVTAFYQYEPNTFSQVFHLDTAMGISYYKYENYGNSLFYGLNMSASVNPVKNWETQLQASANVQKIDVTHGSLQQNSAPLPVAYISINNTVSLNQKKTWVAQANIFYISKYRNDLLEIQPQCNLDAGLKAFFFDKTLAISLSANDILRTLTVHGDIPLTGQSIDNYFDERNVRLTVNYKFGKSNNRVRHTGVEDEGRRM